MKAGRRMNVDYKKIKGYGSAKNYVDMEPGDFVRFQMASPSEIERTEIIPPELGKSGYGKIRVYFRRPRYRFEFGREPEL